MELTLDIRAGLETNSKNGIIQHISEVLVIISIHYALRSQEQDKFC